jgi:hypothetical protein
MAARRHCRQHCACRRRAAARGGTVSRGQPGRRFSAAAGALMLLAATAHTIGHVPLLAGADRTGSIGAMSADRVPLGFGMAPSMLDVHLALVLTMSVTFVALGVITLLIVLADVGTNLHRRVLWVDTISMGALVVVYAYYRIPPPLVSVILITALLGAALFRARRREVAKRFTEAHARAAFSERR